MDPSIYREVERIAARGADLWSSSSLTSDPASASPARSTKAPASGC